MLMDMLGIFIGFCAIMLLFSLLVTAVVHGAQAALNLRLKNLKNVIEAFFHQVDFLSQDLVDSLLTKIDQRAPEHVYATALPVKLPGNTIKLTSIRQQELVDIIHRAHELSIEQREQLAQKVHYHFDILEELMCQRFKQWMHQISIATAFLICFSFQLNCFSILNDLNEDSYYRAQAANLGSELIVQSDNGQLDNGQTDRDLTRHMQTLNFEITPNEWRDYYFSLEVSTFTHWLGVIFSSILISLGAPFWFNRLKDLISLRDKLSPSKNNK